jgi:polyhydroxyalkanoate synthase
MDRAMNMEIESLKPSREVLGAPACLDRNLHAMQARYMGSLSPVSLLLAFLDWELHLMNAPGRRLTLLQEGFRQWAKLANPQQWIAPAAHDRRFQDQAWLQPPFNLFAESFLLLEDWWRQATASLPGVTRAHQDVVAFTARQLLDIFSPSNFPVTNPEVLQAAARSGGMNFYDGWRNYLEDVQRVWRREPLDQTDRYQVGVNVAVTPGKVVFRNELMELIQYAPQTATTRPEPVLVVPAWIMKYYILDLSPGNSFVRYLVSQGFTVFCISWRNPGAELRDTTFDDYRRLGVMAALEVIGRICGSAKVHACGYCLGGTLMAIAAAAMARDGDERLASLTLLAAQTDFTEAGELQLFTDESQLALLDDVMWRQGYLDSSQMAGAFQILRSNDLVWSRLIKTYLLGERDVPNDLMAWNADATRMPFRMHSEYLHHMFLHNDLAEGRYLVEGRPATISEISVPLFAVSTETDHVAPWRSVYKVHLLNEGKITFVLTSGGHNAGIVSEPGHPNRHFRIATRQANAAYDPPESWCETAQRNEGSWWPAYATWLGELSGPGGAPPPLGKEGRPLCDAPGTYVCED